MSAHLPLSNPGFRYPAIYSFNPRARADANAMIYPFFTNMISFNPRARAGANTCGAQ